MKGGCIKGYCEMPTNVEWIGEKVELLQNYHNCKKNLFRW